MKYILRLNPRAFNPLTKQVIPERLWEIEQCEQKGRDGRVDSEKCIWHCADVRVDSHPIRELFVMPKDGEKPFEMVMYGICVRGQDNAIEIKTGKHDASGG